MGGAGGGWYHDVVYGLADFFGGQSGLRKKRKDTRVDRRETLLVVVQFSTSLKGWVKHRVKLSTDTHPDWTHHTRREYAQEAIIVKKLLHSLIGKRNEATSRTHGESNELNCVVESPAPHACSQSVLKAQM